MPMPSRLFDAIALTLILAALAASPSAAAGASELHPTLRAPAYSVEGTEETLEVTFDRPVAGEVELEVYTFHYPMRPDLALEEDSWSHTRQMRHMAEVRGGRRPPFDPVPTDPRIVQILEASSVETLALERRDALTYSAPWTAAHGRLFFRVRLDGSDLGIVETSRVHCAHVDLRSVEQLKETLELLETPLRRGHAEVVDALTGRLRSVYRSGHSFRHMLVHHELGLGELDSVLAELETAVAARDWTAALRHAERFAAEISLREASFVEVRTDTTGDRLRVTLADRIQGFAFAADPETAVYLRQGPRIAADQTHGRIMASIGGAEHAMHDPARHAATMGFDREELIGDGIRLDRVEGGFAVDRERLASGSWLLIVLYGQDQGYYLTHRLAL